MFVARAVNFCKLELAEICGSGQKTGNTLFLFFDPDRICITPALAEIYGSGQKTGNTRFLFFDPDRICITLALAEIYGSGAR